MWTKLDEFPPALVRCLAREKIKGKSCQALSDEEVALSSNGLDVGIVRGISKQLNWDSVPIGLARKFCKGCNFDPLDSKDRNRAGALMRSNTQFAYLKSHPHWERTFLPLVKAIKDAA